MASLNLRNGPLGKRLAAHLLRRATFRITPARISEFSQKTAAEAVDELFSFPDYVHPEGPVSYDDGMTAWLTEGPYDARPESSGIRRRSVEMWFFNELMHDTSVRHKMAMFWNAIFVSALDEDWRRFDRWRLFQYLATGNVKELAYRVTLDPAMLRYLNNNVNKKTSPNENYAREFLELFTILKGETIGAGNYTNYTEADIQEAARVLTGFRDGTFDNKDDITGLATGYAQYSNHDPGNKKFSSAFGYQEIVGAVDAADMYRELSDFVDMIFAKPETARAYVRKLYLFFVADQITDEIESDIIAPLAGQLLDDGYVIENTLKTLLSSVHFFDEDDSDNTDEIIGGKIKPPLELLFHSTNFFEANQIGVLNADANNYNTPTSRIITQHIRWMGFPDYPESVEGYPGFFKSPSFGKFWFDQSNIAYRFKLSEAMLTGTTVSNNNSIPFRADVVPFFATYFTNQEYANELVRQFLEMTLPEMPDAERFAYFADKLLGGLSPINWMFEWMGFMGSGDDSSIRIALENLFDAVVKSPEYNTF